MAGNGARCADIAAHCRSLQSLPPGGFCCAIGRVPQTPWQQQVSHGTHLLSLAALPLIGMAAVDRHTPNAYNAVLACLTLPAWNTVSVSSPAVSLLTCPALLCSRATLRGPLAAVPHAWLQAASSLCTPAFPQLTLPTRRSATAGQLHITSVSSSVSSRGPGGSSHCCQHVRLPLRTRGPCTCGWERGQVSSGALEAARTAASMSTCPC